MASIWLSTRAISAWRLRDSFSRAFVVTCSRTEDWIVEDDSSNLGCRSHCGTGRTMSRGNISKLECARWNERIGWNKSIVQPSSIQMCKARQRDSANQCSPKPAIDAANAHILLAMQCIR